MKTRDIVVGGLLAAIAIMIPLLLPIHLSWFIFPLFSYIASHVPYCCQWPLAPAVAVFTGIVSGIGFCPHISVWSQSIDACCVWRIRSIRLQ